jgi:hypothetical protein
MMGDGWRLAGVFILGFAAGGCGTGHEKTAPCKRPANLSSYAPDAMAKCGPTGAVNIDRRAALEAIEKLSLGSQ